MAANSLVNLLLEPTQLKKGIYCSKSWSLWVAVLSFVLTCEEQLLTSSMTADWEALGGLRLVVPSTDGLETFLNETRIENEKSNLFTYMLPVRKRPASTLKGTLLRVNWTQSSRI